MILIVFALFHEFIVPLLSEAADERLYEVYVKRLAAFFAFVYGAAADIPFVIVYGFEFAKILYANRI